MNFDFTVLGTDRGINPLPSRITVHPSQVCLSANTNVKSLIAIPKSDFAARETSESCSQWCIVYTEPGKPRKSRKWSIFTKIQGKPGIVSEFSIIFIQVRENSGKTNYLVSILFSLALSMIVRMVVCMVFAWLFA